MSSFFCLSIVIELVSNPKSKRIIIIAYLMMIDLTTDRQTIKMLNEHKIKVAHILIANRFSFISLFNRYGHTY